MSARAGVTRSYSRTADNIAAPHRAPRGAGLVLPASLQPGERVEPAFGAVDAGESGEGLSSGLDEGLAALGVKAAHAAQMAGKMTAADELGKGELGFHWHAAMDQPESVRKAPTSCGGKTR